MPPVEILVKKLPDSILSRSIFTATLGIELGKYWSVEVAVESRIMVVSAPLNMPV